MKYKRLLLKISGEALQNREKGLNHDPDILNSLPNNLKPSNRCRVSCCSWRR